MTENKLTKLEPLKDLLANIPASEGIEIWRAAANSAIIREYVSEWLDWFTANRSKFGANKNTKLRNEVSLEYSNVAGQYTLWFWEAIDAAKNYDPDIQKPILTLYFAAHIEILTSLKAYQRRFNRRKKANPESDTDYMIGLKIENSAIGEPGTFLFGAFANGYEHCFSFLFRMLSQFQQKYQRPVVADEYDQLTKQLTRELFKEALLSRKENIVFETFFDKADAFFSFQETGGVWKLGINSPSDQQKTDLLAYLEKTLTPQERTMQELRALPRHYGCPAAVHAHGRKSPLIFIARDVFAVVRRALWPEENLNIEKLLIEEKRARTKLGSQPHP